MFYFLLKLMIIHTFVVIVYFYVKKGWNVNVVNFMHEKLIYRR